LSRQHTAADGDALAATGLLKQRDVGILGAFRKLAYDAGRLINTAVFDDDDFRLIRLLCQEGFYLF
jgi:hypothetical protein